MKDYKVLRASQAGFPCDRNLWYSVNLPPSDDGVLDEKTQRIFDVGTYLEPMVVEWLRQDGWTVEYNAGSQNAELEVFVSLNGGKIAGHPDCFISRGDVQNVLADIKTMNDRAFTFWKREGTLKSKPQYVDQLHIYAQGCMNAGRKVERLALIGLNKNNSDLYIDFFDYDPERMAEIERRSEAILKAEQAPVENSPRENWCCNYCEFAGICEMFGLPLIQGDAEYEPEISFVEDKAVLAAMNDLKRARELGKEARDLEASAKFTIDEHIKATGQRVLAGNGLIFRLVERESSRFDTTAFKNAHPEMLGDFMKTSTSLVYDIKEQ